MIRLVPTAMAGAGLLLLSGTGTLAADLYTPNSWSAMASDRRAQHVGDSLTVVVYENSLAQNSSLAGSQKSTQLSGQASAGAPRAPAQLGVNGQFDSQAQSERSGKLVAQISVLVVAVLPNGDLQVVGEQVLNVAGDRTKISIKGRVRPQDVSASNTVVSTHLANAMIDYDGTGFVSRGAKPGPINRLFNLLGLL